MNDNEIQEIQGLNNDDLLNLYEQVIAHLKYLKESVINEITEGGDTDHE